MSANKLNTAVRNRLRQEGDRSMTVVFVMDCSYEELREKTRGTELAVGEDLSDQDTSAACVSGPGRALERFADESDSVTRVQLIPTVICS
jgi:hypothetical protein